MPSPLLMPRWAHARMLPPETGLFRRVPSTCSPVTIHVLPAATAAEFGSRRFLTPTPSRPHATVPLFFYRPAPLSALLGSTMMAGTSCRARRHNTCPSSRSRTRTRAAGAGAGARPTSERAVGLPRRGSSCYGLGRHGCWGGPSALERKRRRRGHEPRGRQTAEIVRIDE